MASPKSMRGGDRVWPFWVIDSWCLLGYIGCRFWSIFASFVHIRDRYLVWKENLSKRSGVLYLRNSLSHTHLEVGIL